MSEQPKPQQQATLKLRVRILPVLVICVLVWQIISPARVWMLLLVGLGGAWLGGYIWARALMNYLTLKRELRYGWAQVGDQLQERFTITNQGILPAIWAEVVDHSDLPGSSIDRVSTVGSRTEVQWTTNRICGQRGVFTLGPTSMLTGDPLGIYTVQLEYPQQTGLMVMPPIVPLPQIEVAPGGRAGEGFRSQRDPMELTVSASSVRDYRPGDAQNHIHWRTSARKDELYVRQLESTPTSDWWIFLDLQELIQAGQGWESTSEHGIILTASLVDRGLHNGRAVGLVAYGEKLSWVGPDVGKGQQLRIMRTLTTIRTGDVSFAQLLKRALPRFSRGTSLILITPNVDGEWIQDLLPLIARGISPTVILFDPLTYGGTANPSRIQNLLAHFGIPHYTFSADILDRPEARPGLHGRWEFKVLGTGRAVAVVKPADVDWKRLT